MKKSVKIISTLLVAIILMTMSTACFATNVGGVTFNTNSVNAADVNGVAQKAVKIVKTLQSIAAIIAVVIVAILGIKYMLGSVEEKAEYKKSFMPLIVGIVVVLLSFQIAGMIFGLA